LYILTIEKYNILWPYLSNVAARIYLPFGENFTNETGGLLSSKIFANIICLNNLTSVV
jgi:hypothetical protein